MKRGFVSATAALVLVVSMALPAMALRKICLTDYNTEGDLCSRYCIYYDETGEFAGSIYEDYGC